MFVTNALKKILAEKDIKKAQYAQLKKACETALEQIQHDDAVQNKEVQSPNPADSCAVPTPGATGDMIAVNKYFLPFELALKSPSKRIVCHSLDCLQKLIAYGHILGHGNESRKSGEMKSLPDRIVEDICSCFNVQNQDDDIFLQILKALLTIMASNNVEVHGETLLLIIRTCYNIHLFGKQKVVQETASGSLVQMMNRIFSRMEEQTAVNAKVLSSESNDVVVASVLEEILQSVCHLDIRGEDESCEGKNQPTSEKFSRSPTPTPPDSPSVRAASSQSSVVNGDEMDICDSKASSDENISLENQDIWKKDAFNVFRCLCRLSMKPVKESASDFRQVEYKSKILSLKLLHCILQHAGPHFQTSPIFINAVTKFLCVSLSKNAVSTHPDVFQLSVSIFLELVFKFRQHLKKQIEVFFKDIFFNILESPTSSFSQKWVLIEALLKICSNSQCIVDIYVNYDCDMSSANIFKKMVHDISKIAQGKQAIQLGMTNGGSGQVTLEQQAKIRAQGIECLSTIAGCMVEWIDIQKEQLSNSLSCENIANTTMGSENISTTPNNLSLVENDEKSLPAMLEEAKLQKEILEQGIGIFAKKPKKGVTYLQEQGIIGLSPADIASFFHREERLDKSQIGDMLSDNNDWSRDIMHAYIDQMNFSAKDIVSALRLFLEQFRLPGEAQKIDRLMEKFASRYCETNPELGIFASADTAYVLAYSIIMLTTDLHSPQVKNKMTKEQYIKMNRGINDQQDLPENFLSQIYEEIAANEIRMKASSAADIGLNKTNQNLAGSKQQRLLHNLEMEEISKVANALMESASHARSQFTAAKHAEHVKPMFKLSWTPFLAAFSVGLQDCGGGTAANAAPVFGVETEKVYRICLNGMRNAVKVSACFQLEVERDAFLQALAGFTHLTSIHGGEKSAHSWTALNVQALKCLIIVAQEDGNYLGCNMWHEVLKCISQLDLAHIVLEKKKVEKKAESRGQYFRDSMTSIMGGIMGTSLDGHAKKRDSNASIPLVNHLSASELRKTNQEKSAAGLMQILDESEIQNLIVAIDRIFSNSVSLDGAAIVDFVKALCAVSAEELGQSSPRIFCLQKIVEISYYNMDRIRFQWSRIWEILGDHFNKVGASKNEEIACFTIDSLRQLSVKFLEKQEVAHFRFQNDFLQPFETILKRTSSPVIRDMVVRCIVQISDTQTLKLRSGWKNVFGVFFFVASSADRTEAGLLSISFEALSRVISNHFDKHFELVVEAFQDGVKSLSEFACNSADMVDISMESIRLIRLCATYASAKEGVFREGIIYTRSNYANFPQSPTGQTETQRKESEAQRASATNDRVWVNGWFPVIFELTCIVSRCKLDVRTRALTVLFEVLKSNGENFSQRWWRDIFHIIFRMFDDLKLPEHQHEKFEWMTTTCSHALFSIVDVVSQHFEILADLVLKDIYALLIWCVLQENEQLARSAINCLETLITTNGSKFSVKTWDATCDAFLQLFQSTMPIELTTWQPKSLVELQNLESSAPTGSDVSANEVANDIVMTPDDEKELQKILIKCVVQLELIQAVDNILFRPAYSKREDQKIIQFYIQTDSVRSSEQKLDWSLGMADDKAVDTEHEKNKSGMLRYLTTKQAAFLCRCLRESHDMARKFNSNERQRDILWKSGFRGKSKPNLFKQETFSIMCLIRVLFNLLNRNNENCSANEKESCVISDVDYEALINNLSEVASNSFRYYSSLPPDSHRAAWKPVILLLFWDLTKYANNEERKKVFLQISKKVYLPIMGLLNLEMVPELRRALQCFLVRHFELL